MPQRSGWRTSGSLAQGRGSVAAYLASSPRTQLQYPGVMEGPPLRTKIQAQNYLSIAVQPAEQPWTCGRELWWPMVRQQRQVVMNCVTAYAMYSANAPSLDTDATALAKQAPLILSTKTI